MSSETTVDRARERPGKENRDEGARQGGVAFEVAASDLVFTRLASDDPVPTARQLLRRAGFEPAAEHLIFVTSDDPRLRELELELDQTIDLRVRGVEQFVVFRSDRSWRAILDDRRFEWGAELISGRALKWIASGETSRIC